MAGACAPSGACWRSPWRSACRSRYDGGPSSAAHGPHPPSPACGVPSDGTATTALRPKSGLTRTVAIATSGISCAPVPWWRRRNRSGGAVGSVGKRQRQPSSSLSSVAVPPSSPPSPPSFSSGAPPGAGPGCGTGPAPSPVGPSGPAPGPGSLLEIPLQCVSN